MKSDVLSIGAEAVLTKKKMLGKWVVQKTRVPKTYRHAELDARLRKERTVREAKLIHSVKKTGVLAPILYAVNMPMASLYMEFIDAPRLKHTLLDKKTKKDEKRKWCAELGKMIAQLHVHDIVHGDLTTSNVLARSTKTKNELVMIDFGLAFTSNKVEDWAVDFVNLKKTFSATHSNFEEGWDIIQDAYVQNGGKKETLKKMVEVESRIRYA